MAEKEDNMKASDYIKEYGGEEKEPKPKKQSRQAKYDAANTRQITFKFNLKTDADILAKLDEVENRQGYVKDLIRKDLK